MHFIPKFDQLIASLGELEAKATLRLLVEDLLGLDWKKIAAGIQHLTSIQQTRLKKAIERILAGEPPQHITGKAWFYERAFLITPNALIPRRETEELVEWALNSQGSTSWKGLDIGTGSGCIPITLMCEAPGIHMSAIDISLYALELAQANAARFEVSPVFSIHDILNFDKLAFKDLDVIISNPPYVPERERQSMATRVLDHEPELALFVPDADPLRFYEALAKAANCWLKPGGSLFCEIHEDYGQEVCKLFERLNLTDIVLRKDMQGKDRMVKGTLGTLQK